MSPKFLTVATLGVTILGVVFFNPKKEKTDSSRKDFGTADKMILETKSAPLKKENPPGVISPPQSNRVTEIPSAAATNSVTQKIVMLEELSAREDAESFRQIISNLDDKNPSVRRAALDATIQFGNREAVPLLKELATRTEDPREKVEILDAAEFLELPSLSELRAQRRTNSTSQSGTGSEN